MVVIDHLFMKSPSTLQTISTNSLQLVSGFGIEGDASADETNPRQVLVVRAEDCQAFQLPPGYLRENIMVRGLPAEDFSPGTCLHFSGGAKLFLTMYCEPCKTIAPLIPRLSEIVGRRGILGVVLASGKVRVDEFCASARAPFEPMPESPMERVHGVIGRIPVGRVATYRQILMCAGLKGPYYRVMPKYLVAALENGLPAHRVVDTAMQVPVATRHCLNLLMTEIEQAHGGARCRGLHGQAILTSDSLWRPHVFDMLIHRQ